MRPIRSVFLAAGATLLLAVPVVAQGDEPTVNGLIVLPEGSTLEGANVWTLQVQDTSLADAPAVVIGQDGGLVDDETATEIPFAAGFDPEAIDERFTYTLSARIMGADGNLSFINDTAIPVITNGAPVDGVEVPVSVVAPPPGGEARVIELEADPALRFLQDGEQITAIPVTPGETVVFRIDNTAGFAHNFWIGEDEVLAMPGATTDVGIPDWDLGVQELEWVVPDDISGLRFACTLPGHYFLMAGDFTVTP